MYDFFSDHPERGHRFANAMRAMGSRSDLSIKYVVDNFPWGGIGDGIVVDVSCLHFKEPISMGT